MEELTATTETIDVGERCARFFQYSAVHAWDALAGLCAHGAVFARNGVETDLDGMLEMVRGLTSSGIDYAYDDVRRSVGTDGRTVVEQHRTTMHRGDGVESTADVCVVMRFDAAGKIARVDEYVDTAAYAPLFH